MGKTNAQRQAEYRLRQKELGEKRRLNIWLSPTAHKKLGILTKQQGMSQQVLIEWLLTHEHGVSGNMALLSKSQGQISPDDITTLLRNDLSSRRGKKNELKKSKPKKLPRNDGVKVAVKEASENLSQQALEFPSQFELKL